MSTPAERLADVRERVQVRGDRPLKQAHFLATVAAIEDLASTGGGQGPVSPPDWADITGKPAVFPPDLVAHLGAADPHSGYATDADLTAHAAAADPHTGYQRETEKDANSGYAGLDGSGLVPDVRIAATIARDSEVTAAVSAHESDTSVHGIADTTVLATDAEVAAAIATHVGLADPHTGYQRETEKAQPNGYASLDGSGIVPSAQLPASSGGVPTTLTAVGGIQAFVLANDDVSTAAITLRNLAGLVFTFVANAVYMIDLCVFYAPAAATTGIGMAFDTSVAVTRQGLTFEHQLATGGTRSGGDALADAAARGLSSGVPATGTTFVAGKGLLKAGAGGGTCQLMWRPEVAAVATVQAGTMMRVHRVT